MNQGTLCMQSVLMAQGSKEQHSHFTERNMRCEKVRWLTPTGKCPSWDWNLVDFLWWTFFPNTSKMISILKLSGKKMAHSHLQRKDMVVFLLRDQYWYSPFMLKFSSIPRQPWDLSENQAGILRKRGGNFTGIGGDWPMLFGGGVLKLGRITASNSKNRALLSRPVPYS